MPPNPLPDFYKTIAYNVDGTPVGAAEGTNVAVADGADVTQGAKGDTAVTNPALSASEIALLKGLLTKLIATGASGIQIQGVETAGSAPVGSPLLIGVFDGTSIQRLRVDGLALRVVPYNTSGSTLTATIGNSDALASAVGTLEAAWQHNWDGTQWVRARSPTLFASVETAANGSTAIVTSSVSKKLRLLAYQISVTQDAATTSGADFVIKLLDVAADLNMYMSLYVPAASVTTNAGMITTGWVTLGKIGKLMAATNTALNVNLSAALSAGKVRVNVAYCEE